MEKGLIFIISGPAGSGKGTVVKEVKKKLNIGLSVSATTRSPRPGEVDGVHYHFVTRESFEKMIESGEVLEHTVYCGNYYGTLRSEALKIIEDGKDVILEIEVCGASQVKKLLPEETVTVMLIAPSPEELERRLRDRGTESEEVIEKRLKRAKEELEISKEYDYIVTNETGDIEGSTEKIISIINSEKQKVSRKLDFIDGYIAGMEKLNSTEKGVKNNG